MCRCLAGRLSAFLLSCGCSGLLCGVMLPGGCRGLALSMLARRLWPRSSLRPSWPSSPGLPKFGRLADSSGSDVWLWACSDVLWACGFLASWAKLGVGVQGLKATALVAMSLWLWSCLAVGLRACFGSPAGFVSYGDFAAGGWPWLGGLCVQASNSVWAALCWAVGEDVVGCFVACGSALQRFVSCRGLTLCWLGSGQGGLEPPFQ